MKILLNNRQTELNELDKITVKEFLVRMKFTFPMIIIKINQQLIKKEHYSETWIKDGDKVDAIHLIGGG